MKVLEAQSLEHVNCGVAPIGVILQAMELCVAVGAVSFLFGYSIGHLNEETFGLGAMIGKELGEHGIVW